jgi:hypothetical protein
VFEQNNERKDTNELVPKRKQYNSSVTSITSAILQEERLNDLQLYKNHAESAAVQGPRRYLMGLHKETRTYPSRVFFSYENKFVRYISITG